MDRTRYGIEPFDVGYGASFAAEAESPFDIECEVVEDGGVIRAHDPVQRPRPRLITFGTARMNLLVVGSHREAGPT